MKNVHNEKKWRKNFLISVVTAIIILTSASIANGWFIGDELKEFGFIWVLIGIAGLMTIAYGWRVIIHLMGYCLILDDRTRMRFIKKDQLDWKIFLISISIFVISLVVIGVINL